METTRLSSKGQVIIPKVIRERLAWESGQEFVVVAVENGVLLKAKKPFLETSLQEVAGCLTYQGRAKSIEEMDLAIRQGAVEQAHDHS